MTQSYRSTSGHRFAINEDEKPLGEGGEGNVHEVDSSTVAKIYKPKETDSESVQNLVLGRREKKLKAMIANPPPTVDDDGNLVLAWPNGILYDQNGRLAGFTMPRIPTKEFNSIFSYWNPGELTKTLKEHHEIKTQQQVDELLETIAFNFVRIIGSLHKLEYILGDINQNNTLVRTNGNVVFLDSDSFQILDRKNLDCFRCSVSREDFTDPKLLVQVSSKEKCYALPRYRKFCVDQSWPHSKGFGCVDRDFNHDYFAIAVVIFLLIMDGVHPFTGDQGFKENMINRRFSYKELLNGKTLPETLQKRKRRWDNLNEPWQRYFEHTFTKDRRYSAPEVLELIERHPPLTYRNTSSRPSLGKQRSVSSGASQSKSTSPVTPNANQSTGSPPKHQRTSSTARTPSGSPQQNVQGGQTLPLPSPQLANRWAQAASGKKKWCSKCGKYDHGQYRCSNCQTDLPEFKTCTNSNCDYRMNEGLSFCSRCGTAN